jgi:two-component system, chemotaxis family, sensor kinase CheA
VSDGDDEILQAFLEESREGLDQLELDLIELETRPRDPELLAQIYRSVHSIKGTCGFLGYHGLEALTHRGEDLLDALRAGRLAFAPEIATSLLRLSDAIRTLLSAIETTGAEGADADPAILAELAAHLEALPTSAVVAERLAPVTAQPAEDSAAPDLRSGLHETSIRVDVDLLDRLMDLVGELVLIRGKVGELATQDDDGELVACYRQLRRVSGGLLESVMRARLQPVGTVTRKFPRIARDLAASMEKLVSVELHGEDVGVDRAVNEALGDALVHLVRNVVDHGIESPADRIAIGKNPEGRLRIAATHEGGRVHVEVADDGRGIDPERLVARAVGAGLLSQEDADGLDGERGLELIFLPGLSTKASVTSVSGRGVGMDAVRAYLERVGGAITVASEVGRGTVFRIDVPLTVAIVPAVVVRSAGGRYCVPQAEVREVLHLGPERVGKEVSDVDGARLLRLRGGLLPLVDLADELKLPRGASSDAVTLLVLDASGRRFGMVVDEVGDTIEVVAKPLTRGIRSIPVFAGATIMADGRPALVLDVDGLADGAGLTTAVTAAEEAPVVGDASSWLVATGTGGRKLAVTMSSVWRLERLDRDRLARGSGADVIDYGNTLLPLVRLDERIGAGSSDRDAGEVDVIICDSGAGRVGLVVDSIDDIVPGHLVPSAVPGRPGMARLELDGRLTELLDIEALVAGAEVLR